MEVIYDALNPIDATTYANHFVNVYGGAVPASADEAIGEQPVLAQFTLGSSPFSPVTSTTTPGSNHRDIGTSSANLADETTPILQSGVATFFRIVSPSGTAMWQGTIGIAGSGADMVFTDTNLVAGDNLTWDSFSITGAEGLPHANFLPSASVRASMASGINSAIMTYVGIFNESAALMARIQCTKSVSGNTITLTPAGSGGNTAPALAAGTPTTFVLSGAAATLSGAWNMTATGKQVQGTIGIAGSGADMIVDNNAAVAVGDNIIIDQIVLYVE